MNWFSERIGLDELSEITTNLTYVSALRFLKTCKQSWYILTTDYQIQKLVAILREKRNLLEVGEYLKNNNDNMETCFTDALDKGKFYLVQTFIDFGADPSVQNNHALLEACQKNRVDIVEFLLKDLRVTSSDLKDCLESVCSGNKPQFVKRLLAVESIPKEVVFTCFWEACKNGLCEVVKVLCVDKRCDPTEKENVGVHVAVQYGHLEVVQFLLTDAVGAKIDLTFKQNVLIRCACQNNRPDVLRFLLTFERANPNDYENDALYTCARHNSADCLKILLHDPRIQIVDQALKTAICKHSVDSARVLLEDVRVDPTYTRNTLFRIACSRGNIRLAKLFLAHPKVNPGDRHNSGIKWAGLVGNKQMVLLLLEDPRVNPCDKNNRAIRRAYEKGQFEIVKILLKDARVQETLGDNLVIYKKMVEMFKLPEHLLYGYIDSFCKIKRLNEEFQPSAQLLSTFDILRLLCIAQNYSYFKRIIKESNPDLSELNNSLLCIACEKGNVRFVKRILKDKRVDPAADKNWPIRLASWYGHDEVVIRLLKCPTVDPAIVDKTCIWLAYEKEHQSTCKILFKDKRVYDKLSADHQKYFENYTK